MIYHKKSSHADKVSPTAPVKFSREAQELVMILKMYFSILGEFCKEPQSSQTKEIAPIQFIFHYFTSVLVYKTEMLNNYMDCYRISIPF